MKYPGIILKKPDGTKVGEIKSNFDVYMAVQLSYYIYDADPSLQERDQRLAGLTADKTMDVILSKDVTGTITNSAGNVVLIWGKV